jgi:hypothetical protein
LTQTVCGRLLEQRVLAPRDPLFQEYVSHDTFIDIMKRNDYTPQYGKGDCRSAYCRPFHEDLHL